MSKAEKKEERKRKKRGTWTPKPFSTYGPVCVDATNDL